MTAPRFEGSYLGAADRISPAAIMECKICWTVYDPAEGDDFRQILPGTPFAALPGDWTCPTCDAPRDQFMVREDPGAQDGCSPAHIAHLTEALTADFREIWHAKMRDVPLVNKSLHVEAVGFAPHQGRPLGVLVAPWFMNLILLPAEGEDWSDLVPGAKEAIDFPSGSYEFIHNVRPMVGGYKACSLFSPMSDFASQMQAVEVARAVMAELFKAENRAETDRTAEIRATREAELAAAEAAEAAPPAEPTRRAVISAGLAQGPGRASDE
ncbi:[NiFe]-hydrogenase assembly chaperone HybE [Rhodovulum adriaticum]|uniref:[NiFe] hydrogenase assembly HybE family chaperone n=1 Tax=Rhodovulum adriaticum TaxID=35804 RepID=A0A4R2NL28_RHOAD|nr:[NiFe]-hydrogenase assembly chaperone HybE [Rhodovulum adriaticum]MBK1635117.1 rubredoxin [Rhodovulum adriaticum]TCP22230.1 [NiFe] hydrogenase assembly HybE family chaperone [Rhodovulum adriaticum]